MPLTSTLPRSASTRRTSPVLRMFFPAITTTMSPFLTCVAMLLHHLGGQRDDLHEVLFAQLAGDGPEDAGAAGVAFLVDDHHGAAVEADVAAVGAADGICR